IQTLAPSTRTEHPPADPFIKAYQGLEGLTNLPWGHKAASDVVTGEPDLAAQLGGLGLGLGVLPPVARKVATGEFPKVDLPEGLMNERGNIMLPGGTEPDVPAFYSRIDKAFEKLPEKVDPGQMRNILSGLSKEEAKYREL